MTAIWTHLHELNLSVSFDEIEPRERVHLPGYFLDGFVERQRTLESLQSRAGKENRATIFATLGCCRVRWMSRTRMGTRARGSPIPIVRDGQPSGRQSHLFVYQLRDSSYYLAGVGGVRACCRWDTPCSVLALQHKCVSSRRAGTS